MCCIDLLGHAYARKGCVIKFYTFTLYTPFIDFFLDFFYLFFYNEDVTIKHLTRRSEYPYTPLHS